MPPDALKSAYDKVKNFENAELVEKNAVFTDYIQNGVEVRYFEGGEERSGIVRLADYKKTSNNSFVIANQWTFIEDGKKRPDIILLSTAFPWY